MTEGTSSRILVIDDEQSIREMLAQALEIGGFEVETATDGKEGLEKFSVDKAFDVVLTDLMMPKVNGMQVLEEVKRLDPTVELIMLTGFGGNESAIEAMKKGAYDYLQKPTNVEELFITVQKAIERRRLSEENRQYQRNLERLVRERTRELSETKNFLQSILDSSLDYSIIATGLNGVITLFNKGSERLTGFSAKDSEAKMTIYDLVPGLEEKLKKSGKDGLKPERGTPRETECTVMRADGEMVTVSMSIATLTNQKKTIVGMLFISKDITEQKALEIEVKKYTENLEQIVEERTEELARRNEELEKTLHELSETQQQLLQSEKLASIGQLAAGVAHEINNPIGFVHSNLSSLKKFNGRLQQLLKEIKTSVQESSLSKAHFDKLLVASKIEKLLPELDTMIDESLDGTQRVRTIVSDLKNFSNIDRAQIQDADLEAGLESTLNIVWNEIKYSTEVEKHYGKLPLVTCNPQQINQVFLNLLINASHAIKEPPGRIIITTEKLNEETVAITIQDNGTGIPENIQKKIFDPFFSTKPIGEGTGLGLSISYRIIKDHGGEIEVFSRVGEGATFRIILPIKGPMSAEVG
ncbi:MAG: response regulator [bacterium]